MNGRLGRGSFILTTLCFVLVLAGPAQARRHHRHRPHRPALRLHGHRFVPVTGDWEGTADGYPASFQLLYEPGFSIPYAVENLVRFEPGSCPNGVYPSVSPLIDSEGPASMASTGSFGVGKYDVYGGLTGTRSAHLWSTISYEGTAQPGCLDRLDLHMHPAHRDRVRSGTWLLRYTDVSQDVKVVGGGRIVEGIGIPPETDRCYPNYITPPSGLGDQLEAFIGPTGQASNTFGYYGISVALNFEANTAAGQMVIHNQACPDASFPITASYTHS
jgi:hypothetical protein